MNDAAIGMFKSLITALRAGLKLEAITLQYGDRF
jgi:hypothetical protein